MYNVHVSYDNQLCTGSVFHGDYKACVNYIRHHRAPKGCCFDIVSVETKHLMSYVL